MSDTIKEIQSSVTELLEANKATDAKVKELADGVITAAEFKAHKEATDAAFIKAREDIEKSAKAIRADNAARQAVMGGGEKTLRHFQSANRRIISGESFGAGVKGFADVAEYQAWEDGFKFGTSRPMFARMESSGASEKVKQFANVIHNALDGTSGTGGAVALPESQRETIELAVRDMSGGLIEAMGGRPTARDSVKQRVWAAHTVPDVDATQRRKAAAEYTTVSATGVMREVTRNVHALKGLYQADDDYLDDAEAGVESLFQDGLSQDFASKLVAALVDGVGSAGATVQGLISDVNDATAGTYDWYAANNVFEPGYVVKSGAQGALGTGSGRAADADAHDKLQELAGSLRAQFRGSAVWLMHPSVLVAIRNLKDTSGHPLFQAVYTGDGANPLRETLMGARIIVADHMPRLSSSQDRTVIGYGNLGMGYKYFPRRELVLETFRKPDLTEWYLKSRFAAGWQDGQAFPFFSASA